MRDRLLKAVQPLIFQTQSLTKRFVRGTTLGVRVVISDGEEVLLVRHTYVAGWYFPGGGVDPGETAEAAALREADEEAGLALTAPLRLHGVFFNVKMARRDHVLVYHAPAWRRIRAFRPNREIAEISFFPLSDLPKGATAATRARLAEIFAGAPITPDWG